MKLLILGGTRFLGRHLVVEALRSGHEVTLFHRGEGGCDLFPEAEHIHGDRDQDLNRLTGRSWDACVDTCGYVPRLVRESARVLAPAVEHYSFVSTISVYARPVLGMDEEAPVQELTDPTTEEVTGDTYGGLKVLCEQAVEAEMPGRALQVRSGLIVGPFDPTDRFTYWVRRISLGGRVLIPEPRDRPLQFIHAADLGGWILRAAETRTVGIFNVTGPEPPVTMAALLDVIREAGGSRVELVWVAESFLVERDVVWWSEIPLCAEGKDRAVLAVSVQKAMAAELRLRPMIETVRDTLAWDMERGPGATLKAGLTASRESELLSEWSGR